MSNKFDLIVVNAEESIFSGKVTYVAVSGSQGDIGIMANHSPLLTDIKPGIIKYTLEDGKEEVMYTSGGFLEVQPKIVTVLADTVIRANDLDKDRILKARDNALKNINNKHNDVDYSILSNKLSRELAKLKAYEIMKHRIK